MGSVLLLIKDFSISTAIVKSLIEKNQLVIVADFSMKSYL